MNDGPATHEAHDQAPVGRSRYEDLDVATPASATPVGRRTPTLTLATIVLALSGVLPLFTVVLFQPSRNTAIALGLLGVAEVMAAILVGLLRPLGRPVGIAMGIVGVVLGIVTARSSAANGLVSICLNGFVIYALASSGPAFRRE
jgi:hypothetical protein